MVLVIDLLLATITITAMNRSFNLDRHPLANLVFYRSYSRLLNGRKESWEEACDRVAKYIAKIGRLTDKEFQLISYYQRECKSLSAGRVLWVGGTKWIEKPGNYSGAYNCTSMFLEHPSIFGEAARLAMCGCGVGLVIEDKILQLMPKIINELNVICLENIGEKDRKSRNEETTLSCTPNKITIHVGDSKEGWSSAYQQLIYMSMGYTHYPEIIVDFSNVRPAGEILKGFGGISNPVDLHKAFSGVADVLNKAAKEKRRLTPEECCLIVDLMAMTIVKGNVRRSAGMKQGTPSNPNFTEMKQNLWVQDNQGNWRIDPQKDPLRMSNHTQVFHSKPSLSKCIESVRKQYFSGEGAIQYAPEAVYRCNTDIVPPEKKEEFINAYELGAVKSWIRSVSPTLSETEVDHRSKRYGLNPCVTADTWILTEDGPRQIHSILNSPQFLYVDGHLSPTTKEGFFAKGFKPICLLITEEGYRIKTTLDHKVNKVTHQNQDHQYTQFTEVQNLTPGDKIKLHDHRTMLIKWSGNGTREDGYSTFNCIQRQSAGCSQEYLNSTYLLGSEVDKKQSIKLNQFELMQFEEYSYDFYVGFLSALVKNLSSLYYSEKKLHISLEGTQDILMSLQRMLLRMGIASETISSNGANTFLLLISGENIVRITEVLELDSGQVDQLSKYFEVNPNVAKEMFTATVKSIIEIGNQDVYDCQVPGINFYDGNGFHVHNCGEIIGANYHCNLGEVHLTNIDPTDIEDQKLAFQSATLNVASLLNHRFPNQLHQMSRKLDPIVGVSFTGLFDFFVNLFGRNWLEWWSNDRKPDFEALESSEIINKILLCEKELCNMLGCETYQLIHSDNGYPLGRWYKHIETLYLKYWKKVVKEKLFEYCDRHNLKLPIRYTTIQPSGTKSLLSNSSPGWHPPKGIYFIRRITFKAYDPIALAAIDFGYTAVPSQNAKAEDGTLLDDPYDSRAKEWLIEVPVKVDWADLAGDIDPGQFSAIAQIDFSMLCQTEYVNHNTSATWEIRENEIEAVGTWIYESIQKGTGYISAAILARFDDHQTFPRLPFEPISKQKYEELVNRVASRQLSSDFHFLLNKHIQQVEQYDDSPQDMSCSGLKCEIDLSPGNRKA